VISREGLNIAAAGIAKSSAALDEVKPPRPSAGSRQLRSSIAHSENVVL
jgi:hypothetical protein